MATPAHLALQRQMQVPAEAAGGAAASKVVTALWVLGLFTASVAITLLAVREPLPPAPAGLHKNAYLLALSVVFFAGVAGVVMAAVCVGGGQRPRQAPAAGRRGRATATGRTKLVYSVAAVAVASIVVIISLLSW